MNIRGWQCIVCEAIHDRNINAAHNILAADIAGLQKESSSLEGEKDVKITFPYHELPKQQFTGRKPSPMMRAH
jgi:transposase